jgi:hypothetical protein
MMWTRDFTELKPGMLLRDVQGGYMGFEGGAQMVPPDTTYIVKTVNLPDHEAGWTVTLFCPVACDDIEWDLSGEAAQVFRQDMELVGEPE